MAQLLNRTKNQILSHNLQIASSTFSRMRGLLGKASLEKNEMLWIHRCNSIHSFFMKFPIDCVFLNRHQIVCSLRPNIRPWRIVFPIWGASSVVEMEAGAIKVLNIEIGDQFHVGD